MNEVNINQVINVLWERIYNNYSTNGCLIMSREHFESVMQDLKLLYEEVQK